MAIALESGARRMETAEPGRRRSLARYRRGETLEYRVIYGAAFPAFLAGAIVERVLPSHWRRRASEAEVSRSVVAQARHAASTCAAYALMG
jgi:hypothetical protein